MNARTRFIAGLIFFGCMIIVWFSGASKFLTFESVKEYLTQLCAYVNDYYFLCVLAYCAVYIGSSVLALPMASLLIIIASILFGPLWGFCFSIIAATLGALASFLIMRYLFAEYVHENYGSQLKAFNAAIAQHGYRYLVLVRMIPVIPFFVVNIVASCLKISWKLFVGTTFFGLMPVTAVYSYAGGSLRDIHSFTDIFTPKILTAFACLISLGIFSIVYERIRAKK